MTAKDDEIEKKIFFHKYKPEKKIGEGSFGKIYSAVNIQTNEKYALKMESKDAGQNLLESEAYVLCYLKDGIPAVRSYGFSGDHNVLVMELLYKSLEDLFQDCGGKFSLKTVCMLADQMLERIEYIHNKHIIHRDIKPDNFVVGLAENSQIVYLIDFGLAKKFRSSRTLQHIKFTNNKKLTGTARYASTNALKGCEQSRRDDLEAIGYVLMYFLRGSLPWQGLRVDRREDRYKKIYEKKKATSAEELCANFPSEFTTYINYTRNLDFEQEPEYTYLRGLFRKVMQERGLQYDYLFDWVKKENNIIDVRNNDNYLIDNRNKQTLRPVMGNNFTNQNYNVTESIVINNHNNQMITEEKYINNKDEKFKILTNMGVTESYVKTQMNKQDNRESRNPNNIMERNQRGHSDILNNQNEDRKITNMANSNTFIQNTNNENVNKYNSQNNLGLEQNENRKKNQLANLDNKQNELLEDNTKEAAHTKKKNKNCSIL